MDLDGAVESSLMNERLAELRELQDDITAAPPRRADRRRRVKVLVDEPGVARSTREAPEIDGIIEVPADLDGRAVPRRCAIVDALGPDLVAESN